MAALITAADLGIDTTTDQGLFDWLLARDGGYHRMSSVMSEELRDVMRSLIADYDGSVARLVRTARTREEISQRLQRFKGVGPKTAEVFLREVPDAVIGTA
jgi:endonuclease III